MSILFFNKCYVPEVPNGYINANGVLLAARAIVLPGTEIRLSCWNHTVLLGAGKSTCLGSTQGNIRQQWQPRIGSCIKHPGCGRVPVVAGGHIDSAGDSHMGATRLIKCYEGYILTGASFIRCRNDMVWSQPGSCVPMPAVAVLDLTQVWF